MDLFNTLGQVIGGIDAQDELYEPELKEYGVTVELTVSAVNEKEAILSAQSLLERVNKLSKIAYDIERVIEL